jgi:hypothetical protein
MSNLLRIIRTDRGELSEMVRRLGLRGRWILNL